MEQKIAVRNAGMAVLQVIVSGGILFALFYVLLRTIGAAQFGVWALVLATVSATRVSELGLSGGVVKFVAKHLAKSDHKSAGEIIQTAAVSIAVLLAFLLVLVYPFIAWAIAYFVDQGSRNDALNLLPFAMLCIWFTAIGGVFLSGLDGAQRTDIRSVFMIVIAGAHLVLVFLLVPNYGLVGLAYAQLIQSVLLVSLSWPILRVVIRDLPLLPVYWAKGRFREMFAYGLNFQVISVAQMMFDPTTKALLSKFGALDMVSYYEMANRMVGQFRSVLISANSVLVPIIAGLHEKTPGRVATFYRGSYQILLYLALPLYAGIVALVPVVAEIWIGSLEPSFVAFATLLTIGWFVNTLAAPAYFSNLGIGDLRWNTISHVTMGISNVALGLILGMLFGGIGVVSGFVLALIIGSALVTVGYHAEHHVSLHVLLPPGYRHLGLGSTAAAIVTWFVYFLIQTRTPVALSAFVCVGVFSGVVAPFLLVHPLRSKLTAVVSRNRMS
jgi:O-antigen/teichoic acid export membrane protein